MAAGLLGDTGHIVHCPVVEGREDDLERVTTLNLSMEEETVLTTDGSIKLVM